MATVYSRINGLKIQKAIAVEPAVQERLERTANRYASRASAILEEPFREHNHDAGRRSYISVEHGRVDYYVVLNDERGQRAAGAIEFGRDYGDDKHSTPVAALHGAFGGRGMNRKVV